MHMQVVHTQAPCVEPRQHVGHLAHTTFKTWPSGSSMEGPKSNWAGIMLEHTLMSPQGTPKKAYNAL